MIRKINLCGRVIEYSFEYKNVKNINLRIKSDCSVTVSAKRNISIETVERFIESKSSYILNAIDKYTCLTTESRIQYFSENEIKQIIESLCDKAYPYYCKKGVVYPTLKFRKMVSMWGNCYPQKSLLTFNLNLIYAPLECIEYVVWHEFTHFIEANHSKKFYDELSIVYPAWKNAKAKLKGIILK